MTAEVIKWVFGILLVLGILAVIAYPIVGLIYGNRKWLQQIYGENWKEKKKEYWKEYGRDKLKARAKAEHVRVGRLIDEWMGES